MKKLSEINPVEGMRITGKLIPILTSMVKKTGGINGMGYAEYIGKLLETAPEEAVQVCAAIDGKTVDEYMLNKNFLDVIRDVNTMISDDVLENLFRSQAQTVTSSASAM